MSRRGWSPGPLSPSEPTEPDFMDQFETETDIPPAPRPDESWWRDPAPAERSGSAADDDGPPTLAPGFGTASPAYGHPASPAEATTVSGPAPDLESTEPGKPLDDWSEHGARPSPDHLGPQGQHPGRTAADGWTHRPSPDGQAPPSRTYPGHQTPPSRTYPGHQTRPDQPSYPGRPHRDDQPHSRPGAGAAATPYESQPPTRPSPTRHSAASPDSQPLTRPETPAVTRPSSRRLLSATAIMAAGTLASRVLGLVRVVLAAWLLGTNSRQADIFSVATTVPNSLYFLFAGGALNTVLVPQLVRAVKNDPDGGEAYTNRVMTAFLMLVGGIALILVLAARVVAWVYSDAGWHTPELQAHFDSMVLLTALCLPQVFFYGAFFLGGQVLNARDAFGPMMWAPIANNLVQVLVLATYAGVWGSKVDTSAPFTTSQALVLGLGSVLGIATQVGVLVPFLRRVGFRYRPRFDLRHTGLGHTFHLAKWTLGFVALNQVALLVVTKLATSATAGGSGAGMTTYNNANLLWVLPHSLITVGLATAILPSLSRMAAEQQEDAVRTELTSALRMATTALVPVALLYLTIGVPIAEMAFRGPSKGGDLVGWTLVMFAVGLVPFSLQYLVLRGYYAYEDTRSTFFLQMLITALNAGLALLLVKVVAPGPNWVAPMLALSYTIAYVIGLVLSLLHFKTVVPSLDLVGIGAHLGRVTLAALPGTVVGAGLVWFQASRWDGLVVDVLGLAVGVAVALGGYLVLARRLGLREVDEVVSIVLRRLGRGRRPQPSPQPGPQPQPQPGPQPEPLPETEAEVTVARATALLPLPGESPEPVPEPAADLVQTAVRATVGPVRPVPPPALDDATPADLVPGDVIDDRYRLDELIVMRGSTGTWKAYDRVLSRPTLVHLLSPDSPRTPQVLEAARTAARATDSRFLRVLDAVDDETGCYIVCEWAEGALLETLLTAGPLTAVESAWVVRELSDALATMHAVGLYHQRLHPESIVVSATGNIKIIGFLIDAALYGSLSRPPQEQEAADLEAMGKVLYACLTSRWPGGGFGLAAAPRDPRGHLLAPARVRAGVSPSLDRITSDILAPSATGLRSCSAVAKDLSLVLGGSDASTDLANRVRLSATEVPYGLGRGGNAPVPAADPVPLAPQAQAQPQPQPTAPEPTVWTPRAKPAAGAEPTMVAPIRQPSRRAWWLLPAAVVLTVSVVTGTWFAVRGRSQPAPTGPAASTSAPAHVGPYAIATARDFDPESDGGNGEENPNLVPQAYDKRPDTAWKTLSYRGNARLGGLKPGVGLVVDLGQEQRVGAVRLTLVGTPTTIELRTPAASGLTSPPMDSQKSWRVVAQAEATETEVEIVVPDPVTTRFVLVYLTSLPPVGGNYQAAIAEVQVMP